jgi:hypothetical protein
VAQKGLCFADDKDLWIYVMAQVSSGYIWCPWFYLKDTRNMHTMPLALSNAIGQNFASVRWRVPLDAVTDILLYLYLAVELLAAVALKIPRFWKMTPCNPLKVNPTRRRNTSVYPVIFRAEEYLKKEINMKQILFCFLPASCWRREIPPTRRSIYVGVTEPQNQQNANIYLSKLNWN